MTIEDLMLVEYLENKCGIEIPRDEPENLDYYIGYWSYWAGAALNKRSDESMDGWDTAQYDDADIKALAA